jgi:hypothetical protein
MKTYGFATVTVLKALFSAIDASEASVKLSPLQSVATYPLTKLKSVVVNE